MLYSSHGIISADQRLTMECTKIFLCVQYLDGNFSKLITKLYFGAVKFGETKKFNEWSAV